MRQLKTLIIVSLSLVCLAFGNAMAGDHPTGHDKSMEHPTGDHPAKTDMDHSGHGHDMGGVKKSDHLGDRFRTATVEGHQLSYELIDMREKMKEMKAAGHQHAMTMTHHMMVYVKTPDGGMVDSAKVGYLVVGPNKEKQKLMCMSMSGGYGADVDFTVPGTYTVKTKVVVGEKKIIDSFSHRIN